MFEVNNLEFLSEKTGDLGKFDISTFKPTRRIWALCWEISEVVSSKNITMIPN